MTPGFRSILALLSALLACAGAGAQQVRGVVTDAADGIPLPGVCVKVDNGSGSFVITDFDGRYAIPTSPAGRSIPIFITT